MSKSKTLVNITLVQEGDKITVRSDAVGEHDEVLSLGLQILSYLAMLEHQCPGKVTVDIPTLSCDTH